MTSDTADGRGNRRPRLVRSWHIHNALKVRKGVVYVHVREWAHRRTKVVCASCPFDCAPIVAHTQRGRRAPWRWVKRTRTDIRASRYERRDATLSTCLRKSVVHCTTTEDRGASEPGISLDCNVPSGGILKYGIALLAGDNMVERAHDEDAHYRPVDF